MYRFVIHKIIPLANNDSFIFLFPFLKLDWFLPYCTGQSSQTYEGVRVGILLTLSLMWKISVMDTHTKSSTVYEHTNCRMSKRATYHVQIDTSEMQVLKSDCPLMLLLGNILVRFYYSSHKSNRKYHSSLFSQEDFI